VHMTKCRPVGPFAEGCNEYGRVSVPRRGRERITRARTCWGPGPWGVGAMHVGDVLIERSGASHGSAHENSPIPPGHQPPRLS